MPCASNGPLQQVFMFGPEPVTIPKTERHITGNMILSGAVSYASAKPPTCRIVFMKVYKGHKIKNIRKLYSLLYITLVLHTPKRTLRKMQQVSHFDKRSHFATCLRNCQKYQAGPKIKYPYTASPSQKNLQRGLPFPAGKNFVMLSGKWNKCRMSEIEILLQCFEHTTNTINQLVVFTISLKPRYPYSAWSP